MIKQPLDTTVCQLYDSKKTQDDIATSLTYLDSIPYITQTDKDGFVIISANAGTPVVHLPHPVTLINQLDKELVTIVDVFDYTRVDRQGNVIIKSSSDHNLTVLRGHLQHRWAVNPKELSSASEYPGQVFVRWLSGILSRRFGLEPDTQSVVSTIVGIYWFNLFEANQNKTASELDRFYGMVYRRLTRLTFLSIDQMKDIGDRLGNPPTTIEGLCQSINQLTETVRLDDLNLISLLEITGGGSWFGAHSREIVGVGLEHPPTFIALCYSALKERTYRKSLIGQVADNTKRSTEATNFVRTVDRLIDTQ